METTAQPQHHHCDQNPLRTSKKKKTKKKEQKYGQNPDQEKEQKYEQPRLRTTNKNLA